MVTIKQPSIWGRLGAGVGQGLAEQLPKEVERSRLSSGLKQFEKESANLSPIQQLARLSSIPGITPQMVESFGQLARQQSFANAFGGQGTARGGGAPGGGKGASTQQGGNVSPGQPGAQAGAVKQAPGSVPQVTEGFPAGGPQIVPENPVREEAIPRSPWTAERRNTEIGNIMRMAPGISLEQAIGLANDSEKRELAQPISEQERDTYRKEQRDQLEQRFTDSLQEVLQKEGKETFEDLTGEMQNNLKAALNKDIASGKYKSPDDAVRAWVKKGLDLSKAKTALLAHANDGTVAKGIVDPSRFNDSLKATSDIFRDAGNSEEFFNILRASYNLSPRTAASVAYPVNKDVKSYIKSTVKTPPKTFSPSSKTFDDSAKRATKYANDIAPKLTTDDSLLSIARELRQADQLFDDREFLQYFIDQQQNIGLTDRQRRELAFPKTYIPTWPDLLIK